MGEGRDTIVVHDGMTPWQKAWAFLGPGLVIATVYVDPGQMVVDMETGSAFQYRMLWVTLATNAAGCVFQHLSSRLTIVTGRDLATECRLEYPAASTRVFLCLTVELASIAADLGYVTGTATALNILTGVDLTWGVLLTGFDTCLALGLQSFGIRKVEAVVGAMFGLVVCCYLVELVLVRPSVLGIVDGLLPRLWHKNNSHGYDAWLSLLCANLGAAVCPPNFFLHTALVRKRKMENRRMETVLEAFEYNLYETGACLGLATLVNVAMLVLAAAHFYPERVTSLAQGADLLKETLGGASKTVFAVAMLCAGQSSSLTGVLSSQYILEGFFDTSVPAWVIRACTRAAAIVPAFYVVYTRGPDAAAELIEQAQVVVNFVVPFTVIPLINFLASPEKMGPYRLSKSTENACWAAAGAAVVLNLAAIQQAIDEDIQVRDDGIKLGCTLLVTGAYAYASWWFFTQPVTVATRSFGTGVLGSRDCGRQEKAEREEGKLSSGATSSHDDAGPESSGCGDGDCVDDDHNHALAVVINGEVMHSAWHSSPGIGFFLRSGSGGAGSLQGVGADVTGDGQDGRRMRAVWIGLVAAAMTAVCLQMYREAGNVRCLLDHVGVMVGEGCDIAVLRGRTVGDAGLRSTTMLGAAEIGRLVGTSLSSALDAVDGNPIQQL